MSFRKNGRRPNHIRENDRLRCYSDLVVVYEGDDQEIPIRVPDLSTKGMFINTARPFPEGAILQLRFRLSRPNVEVQARAEVRYCLPGVGVGVEFTEISPESQSAIEEEIHATAF